MPEAVTPPNPDQTESGRHGNPPQSVPDPTLMTIDALRREIAMLESLLSAKMEAEAELTRERFHRVDEVMRRFEEQRGEQKDDTRAAVEAALEAQKEATSKMEATVSDQIASLRANFETAISGVRTSIADLKDRATIQESIKQGQSDQKTEHRAVSSTTIAALGVGIAAILAVLAVVSFMAVGT